MVRLGVGIHAWMEEQIREQRRTDPGAVGGESVVGGGGKRSVDAHGRSWRRVIARRRPLRATHCCASLARSHRRLCVRLEAMAGGYGWGQ
jgi:hypothetical protein